MFNFSKSDSVRLPNLKLTELTTVMNLGTLRTYIKLPDPEYLNLSALTPVKQLNLRTISNSIKRRIQTVEVNI